MHFVQCFVDDREVNFFNSNFEFNFAYSFNEVEFGSDDFMPITAANRFASVYRSFSSFINDEYIVESILYMFDNVGRQGDLSHLFHSVSDEELALFDSVRIPGAYRLVDLEELESSSVNSVNVADFVTMRLIKHYMGEFLPIIVNPLVFITS